MKKLSEPQRIVLKSLALGGKKHVLAIQQNLGINYSTVNRSVRRLEKRNLVWISSWDKALGPKSVKEYSLSPYGVVESVLHCGVEDQVDLLLKNWGDYSPCYVKSWEEFKKARLLKSVKEMLQNLSPDIVDSINILKKSGNNKIIVYDKQLCIIHKNILDTIFIEEIFENKYNLYIKEHDKFIEIISKNPEYKKIWLYWFAIKQFLFKYLGELKDQLENS